MKAAGKEGKISSESNSLICALGSGFVGVVAMMALHEFARRTIPAAPQLDTLRLRAIVKALPCHVTLTQVTTSAISRGNG